MLRSPRRKRKGWPGETESVASSQADRGTHHWTSRNKMGQLISFFLSLYLFFKFTFNWRIIALQCCVGCPTTTCISHKYMYIPSVLSLPPAPTPPHPSRYSQSTDLNSLCYLAIRPDQVCCRAPNMGCEWDGGLQAGVTISVILSWWHKSGSWIHCSYWPRSLVTPIWSEGTLLSLCKAVLKEIIHVYTHSPRRTWSSFPACWQMACGNLARLVGEAPWHW